MKKRGKFIAIGLLILLLVLAGIVFFGWKLGKGPLAYLKYDTFHLGEVVYGITEEEVFCQNGPNKIAGTLYRPEERAGQQGIVILAHGLNGTAEDNRIYARILAEAGIAVYAFDFCGGSNNGKSDGNTTSMSVKTEMTDLDCVVEKVKSWDWVDPENVVLMGESLGGLVSSLTAAQREDIRALVLFYPAFSLQDNMHTLFGSSANIPDTFSFMGMELGRTFGEDLWDLDAYARIEAYTGEVLIVHGTKDATVPYGYSKRACNHFPHARLCGIRGADHGFVNDDALEAMSETYAFLREQMQ